MIRRRRSENGPSEFVEAGPSLAERLEELFHRVPKGRARWLAVAATVTVSVLTTPFRLVRGAFDASSEVVRSGSDQLRVRRLAHLLQGGPAIVAIVGTGAAVLLVMGGATALPDTYRRLAADTFRSGRPEDAVLYYERLFRLDGGGADTRLMLGLTLDKLGRADEAEVLIRGVAEGDGGGDPRANRWLASKLVRDPSTASNRTRLGEVRRHLLAAERGMPGDADVALDLARFYQATGQTAEAVAKLEEVAETVPAANVDLMRLYAAQGRVDKARRAAEQAEAHLRSRLKSRPEDRQARLLLTSCLVATRRFDEAVQLLADGTTADPKGPYMAVAANVFIAAYDLVAAGPNADAARMLGLLKEALRCDPRSAAAAVRLAEFGTPAADLGKGLTRQVSSEVEAEATARLEELLASGEQPAAVHMALGLLASRRGEAADATWHFERAYDLDKSLSGVANNLAWMLSHGEKPDLERALGIIQPVLAEWPDVPSYRDTRGEIFLRMGRFEDALGDFERALPTLRSDPRLHRSLAEVYRELGRVRLADVHQKEAERLAASAGGPPSG